jgi:nicotinate-nucleotide adenylyltransferase
MKAKTTKQLQAEVNKIFLNAFSRTPLRQRIQDIHNEVTELLRYVDLQNLREETGDLLASTLQLCNESGWDASELVQETLTKITGRTMQYRCLGRKKVCGIIGGAFNPISVGHIKLAQFVLNTSKTFDEIFIVPCYSHLYGKQLVDAQHRLEMCQIAAQNDGRIKVFDYEIKNKLSGETYHFIKRLLEEDFAKNEYDFSCIIGQDNANTFDKWVNYQDLERMIRFVVVSRKGIEPNNKSDWYLKYPHMYFVAENNEIPETSSTEIRNLMRAIYASGWTKEKMIKSYGELEAKLIDKNVFKYIIEHDLYREGK